MLISFCDITHMRHAGKILPHLPDIRLAAREVYTDKSYQWDNRTRDPDNGLVLQFTLRGSCGYTSPTHHAEVLPGHAMLFRHGENSRYGITPQSTLPYEAEYLIIDPNQGITELFDGLREHHGPILRMDPEGPARQLLLSLILEFQTGRPADRIAHAQTLYPLLLHLYREQTRDTRESDPVAYGRHLLETRYREPKNLKEWCALIGISREHFTREFTRRHHESPAAFLRRLRLQHARSLLRLSPRLPLENIAALSGFASVQTLQRLLNKSK